MPPKGQERTMMPLFWVEGLGPKLSKLCKLHLNQNIAATYRVTYLHYKLYFPDQPIVWGSWLFISLILKILFKLLGMIVICYLLKSFSIGLILGGLSPMGFMEPALMEPRWYFRILGESLIRVWVPTLNKDVYGNSKTFWSGISSIYKKDIPKRENTAKVTAENGPALLLRGDIGNFQYVRDFLYPREQTQR